MKQGKYHRRLRGTFLAITVCFVLCCSVLSGSLIYFRQRSAFRLSLQQTVAARADSARMAMSTVGSGLKAIQSSENAPIWAEQKVGSSGYYFYATQLYHDLARVTTNISYIQYSICLTQMDEASFVITPNGTVAKSDFFSAENAGLTAEDRQQITDHFLEEDTPLLLPVYKSSLLDSLFYVLQDRHGTVPLLYLVQIPAATLFGSEASHCYAVISDDHIVAYGSNAPTTEASLSRSWDTLRSASKETLDPYQMVSDGRFELFFLKVTGIPLTLFYQYSYPMFSIPLLAGFILATALFALLLAAALLYVSERLYRPIQEVVSDVPATSDETDSMDEFQLLRRNVSSVTVLNDQLRTVIKENNEIVTRRYYRELLYGVPDFDCPLSAQQMNACYCVALLELQCTSDAANDWALSLQKNCIYLYVEQLSATHNIHYVSEGYNSCAIILQANERSDAETLLLTFRHIDGVNCKIVMAMSDVQEHIIHLSGCYQQALRILEYRYKFPSAELLTSDYTKVLSDSSYYYPLTLEARLIREIVSGSENAVSLFDSIVRDNLSERHLSTEATHDLIFALCGTLTRVFQELKTTPESLLKKRINFTALYTESNDISATLSLLQEYVAAIVSANQHRLADGSDKVLQKMLDYIYQNYADDIMLQDIADYCGISPTYCSTLFKRLSNDNFKTFLNRYRIDRACDLLQKDPACKISDLSAQVGFNSANSFIRAFSKIIGVTPRAYAEQRCGTLPVES